MLKIGRFGFGAETFHGLVEGEQVKRIENPFVSLEPSGETYSIQDLKVLAPCVPGKAVCVGLNYRDHILEMGHDFPKEPVLFLKPTTSLTGTGSFIEIPEISQRVDYEAELAIVIGSRCKNVLAQNVQQHILGFTCANDVTARDLQSKDGQWTRSKSFDTFLPLGPYIVTGINPDRLHIFLYHNGKIKQESNTINLIFNCAELVSYISKIMTLEPGDIILTGTPSGVGPMKKGDTVEVVIESIGNLVNTVK